MNILSLLNDKDNEEKLEKEYLSKHSDNEARTYKIEEKIDQLENELTLLTKSYNFKKKELLLKDDEENECRSEIALIEKRLLQLGYSIYY